MKKKYTKEAVDYSEGEPSEHCAICTHYQVLHKHGCEIVQGMIMPNMWCNKFQKKPGSK